MSSKNQFENRKEQMLAENEARYGEEIRRKYGDDTVNASYAKVKGMTEEKMQEAESLSLRINETLAEAFAQGDPASELAQKLCEMHKQWLCIYWPDGMYSPEAHMGLADGYVADERFRAYYDKVAEGAAQFLRDAIHIYCTQ